MKHVCVRKLLCVGQRVHLNKDSTKVALVGGVSAEYPVSNDVSTLPPDVQQLVETAKEVNTDVVLLVCTYVRAFLHA